MWNRQNDGGVGGVDHTYEAPEETWEDEVEVMEANYE